MSTGSKKRPSSTKRHIKYECFSKFVSASRLRQVQALLNGSDVDTNIAGLDAILCISGIDSRYNEGCYEVFNYLLFGFFDVRKAELESSGFPDEIIDDLILLVRKKRVDVYCNPINWHYFLPYISHWPNIVFHCLQEDEYDLETDQGTALAEEFKVKSLTAMTSSCRHIGIPYYGMTANPDELKFDKMLVEKWPLIQAFALEGIGGGGFFSMKFEISDVSFLVHQLYSYQDPVTIEILTTENLPVLERQWRTMCDCVPMELVKNKGVLSQERIAEPLCSYFQHGQAGNHSHKTGNRKLPFVLFGKNSSKTCITAIDDCSSPPDWEIHLSSSNTVGHMVCQVVSPRSPLICARTYFVSHLYSALTDISEGSGEHKKISFHGSDVSENLDRSDLRYLVTLYQGMVSAVMAGIQLYARSGSAGQAKIKALEVLRERCHSVMSSGLDGYLSDRSKVEFTLEAVRKDGNVQEVHANQHGRLMKVATLSLYDVPDAQNFASSPGSLVFSECFLDSTITVSAGAETNVDSDILYLTSHIPRYRLWGVNADVQQDHKELKSQLENKLTEKLGPQLMTGDEVEVTAGTEITLPPEKADNFVDISVQLFVYENGVAAYSESYGSFAISASDCSHLHLFDGDSMSTAVLLILTYHPWSAIRLPPHLLSPDNMLIFVIAPRSKAHAHLYGQVLTRWKEHSKMPAVSRIDSNNLPGQLGAMHQYLQQVEHHNALHNLLTAPTSTSLKDATHSLPNLPQFLIHLAASSAEPGTVSCLDFPHLLQKETEFQVTSDIEKVPVTVLTGVPGSEKQILCKNLCQLGKDHIRWMVVNQMEETVLDTGYLYKMLTSAVTAHLQQEINKRQTRVLLVAPGFMNTSDVVGTILKHPDAKVRNMLKIGSVTSCIDPLNVFMKNRMLLPMQLNQCAQGWVNSIIFTSQTKAPNSLLDLIQSLVRSVNSDVALLLAESGEIKRSTDLDQVLSDSAFEQPALIRARLLLHPSWNQTKSPQGPLDMNDVILKFSRPLEKAKLMQKIKMLPTTLSDFPFEGNIYHINGLVCFSDSKNTVDMQYITLSQNLVFQTVETQLQPVIRGQHQYYMVFTGCRLEEATLKDWLRACTKQKPAKKELLRSTDLSKADISKIHKERHLDPLPPGWFYNGTQFVSMTGDKSDQHPNMRDFINDYLQKKNQEIDEYNAAIDTEKYPDLFA